LNNVGRRLGKKKGGPPGGRGTTKRGAHWHHTSKTPEAAAGWGRSRMHSYVEALIHGKGGDGRKKTSKFGGGKKRTKSMLQGQGSSPGR